MSKRVHFEPSIKMVSFEPGNDQVIEIENCMDYSKQELQDYFYTTAQLNRASLQRTTAARQWEADKSKMPSFCVRGLEQCTQEWGDRIQHNIEQCIDAVMDEQQEQWDTEQDNFDRIAAVSQLASKGSVEQALARAEEDQVVAQRIYQQKEKVTKSSSQKTTQSKIKSLLKPVLRIR